MREKVKKPWKFSLGCIWMVWYGYGRDIKNSCLANVNAMTEEEVAEILDLSVEAVNVHKRNGVQCIKNSLSCFILKIIYIWGKSGFTLINYLKSVEDRLRTKIDLL